jgi:cytidylate kinase
VARVITIDGPAASGKSSTAKVVAARLGAYHIDSGSLYRAVTAARARGGDAASHWTEEDVVSAAVIVTLEPGGGGFVPKLGGVRADDELRSPAVTAAVPRVAQMPRVRAWVNERVKHAARDRDVVVDGRDMGTAVFPNANLKIFLVADAWERARRRLKEREGREPIDDDVAEETARLIARDARDENQSAQASDAIVIDTTSLSQNEQVERIVALAKAVRRS